MTFPDTTPDYWEIPSRLWHMDAPFFRTMLAQPQVIAEQPVELRELDGEPGDVHVCHINRFHSAAPNSHERPRMMTTHTIRPAGDAAD